MAAYGLHTLPDELIELIAVEFRLKDFQSFRLTCRRLCAASSRIFGRKYFARVTFDFSRKKLQDLQNRSSASILFRESVTTLTFRESRKGVDNRGDSLEWIRPPLRSDPLYHSPFCSIGDGDDYVHRPVTESLACILKEKLTHCRSFDFYAYFREFDSGAFTELDLRYLLHSILGMLVRHNIAIEAFSTFDTCSGFSDHDCYTSVDELEITRIREVEKELPNMAVMPCLRSLRTLALTCNMRAFELDMLDNMLCSAEKLDSLRLFLRRDRGCLRSETIRCLTASLQRFFTGDGSSCRALRSLTLVHIKPIPYSLLRILLLQVCATIESLTFHDLGLHEGSWPAIFKLLRDKAPRLRKISVNRLTYNSTGSGLGLALRCTELYKNRQKGKDSVVKIGFCHSTIKGPRNVQLQFLISHEESDFQRGFATIKYEGTSMEEALDYLAMPKNYVDGS